ncbi:MAG: protease complex subunit PrcB family protein [Anaerolineae bacterium]|nr:protease complex subunit PrcB family protein [Anaerolineae bacterium]
MQRGIFSISNGYLRLILVFMIAMFELSACTPKEINLSFETIEKKSGLSTSGGYDSGEPFLVVIAQLDEVSDLDGWITEDARLQLQTLDYGTYFVVGVFQGRKGTDGYEIGIERVVRQRDEITFFVQTHEPRPDEKKNDTVTSPYHLVRVEKMEVVDSDLTFSAIVDGNVIATTSHYIP